MGTLREKHELVETKTIVHTEYHDTSLREIPSSIKEARSSTTFLLVKWCRTNMKKKNCQDCST